MDTDRRYGSRNQVSNESPSVATAAQEVQQTWSFAPASQPHSQQQPDIGVQELTNYYNTADQMGPFMSRRRSLDVAAQSSEEEGFLRARRHDSHKSARLMDPKREKGDRISHSSSEEAEHTHISVHTSSFAGHDDAATVQPQSFQRSESRSSRSSDISGSLERRLSSRHQQDFSAAPGDHTPTKPRKTLQERLQGAQPEHARLFDSSNHPSLSRLYRTPSLVKPGHTSLLPAPVITGTLDTGMTTDVEGGDGHASVLGLKTEDAELNARSRSASVSGTSADAKGMQGVVMEAMKTIQRYESENETQVGAYGVSLLNSDSSSPFVSRKTRLNV
jgi:hypothetical protein